MDSQFLVFTALSSLYPYLLIQQCVFRTHQAQHYTSPARSPSHPCLPCLFSPSSHSDEGTTIRPSRSRTEPLCPLSSCPVRVQRCPYTPYILRLLPARDAPPALALHQSRPTPSEQQSRRLDRATGTSYPLGEASPPRPLRVAHSGRTQLNSGFGGKGARSTHYDSTTLLP